MKTITIKTSYTKWNSKDGWISATYRGKNVATPRFFANYDEYKASLEQLHTKLKQENMRVCVSFKHVLN